MAMWSITECLTGKGIMARSEWDVADELAAGRLVALLPAYRLPDADVMALVPQSRQSSMRTQRFVGDAAQRPGAKAAVASDPPAVAGGRVRPKQITPADPWPDRSPYPCRSRYGPRYGGAATVPDRS